MICSTPPTEPVVWLCAGPGGDDPIYVAAKAWFEARAFAATHFSISPSEVRCSLLGDELALEVARNSLLEALRSLSEVA